ncbi:MAG: response regulator [Planctomycetaceae bacterium]|nr:response regulator [Planctomycetaceae bacterium]
MPRILVVDDSPMDRVRVGNFLEKSHVDYRISFAADGKEALLQIENTSPDIVVTDMQMPEMDGFELVREVKLKHPLIPVILITSKGSEQIAAKALKVGAVSYVPKSTMAEHLPQTIERTLNAAYRDRMHSRLMHALDHSQSQFTLQNDPELIELVVQFFEEMLRGLPLQDEGERLRSGEALKHALWHVWLFGNLELDPAIENENDLREQTQNRSRMQKYSSRSMSVSAEISETKAVFRIRHQGAPLQIPEPGVTDTSSHRPYDRAILLMQSIMDQVEVSEDGQLLTLTKEARLEEELSIVGSSEGQA